MSERPNILLMVSEDNGQHLSCYGDDNIETPHLDRLARGGVRFENSYTTQAVCSPGRASLLTGLYPHQNGQFGLATHKYALYDDFPNLQGLLKNAGYRTGMLGKLHINPEADFPLDLWWNDRDYISFGHRDAFKTAQMADAFMGASDDPFFLMVNFSDAHLPFIRQDCGLPEKPLTSSDVKPLPQVGVDSERIREHTADYYNCMLRLDTCVGLILGKLEAMGKADNTLVVFTTDHGAQFSRGKTCIYEGGLRIPLIMRWPKHIETGQVRNDLMSHVDMMPTILDAVGEPCPEGLPGISALGLLNGSVQNREYLFAEWCSAGPMTFFPQRSVRDGRYKLIWNLLRDRPSPSASGYAGPDQRWEPGAKIAEIETTNETIQNAYERYLNPPEFELYDLKNDPWEWVDLAQDGAHEEIRNRLVNVMEEWQIETDDLLRIPENLDRLKDEHDHISAKYYAGNPWGNSRDYAWHYANYLYKK